MESERFDLSSLFQVGNEDRPLPKASASLAHDIVHSHAKAHPNDEAIVAWDGTLTYEELDDTSSRLAAHLVAQGVGPEVIVPLLFEKSRWAVVAMLAVMKASGAFMPLDVSQPVSRLRSIIADSGAVVGLSSASMSELCTTLALKTCIVTAETLSHLKEPVASWQVHPASAAYVMATSGSTGRPKLVVNEHIQLSSFVSHLTAPLGFTRQTRAFQFASFAFDPIIGDIFLTLCAGGTVCIPSEEQRRSDVAGAMNSMQVNLAKLTPSLVDSLPELTAANVPTLSTLVLGGETVPTSLLKEWATKVDLKIIYGSTECTVSCVVTNAGTQSIEGGEIGHPYGARTWIVDSQNDPSGLKLAKQGDVGELVVEGPLVARGYLKNPVESKAKFIEGPDHRIYRTGDLVRVSKTGGLVYVGRADNQVKIRGQRLELEEVEAHIRESLHVLHIRTNSVLVDLVVPLKSSIKQLVGVLSVKTVEAIGSLVCKEDDTGATTWVSPTTSMNFSKLVSLLETQMRSRVPSYMVPSLWVPIDDMLYTISRKRDRQRLRKAIESLSTKSLLAFTQKHHSPSHSQGSENEKATDKEDLLRSLWSDVLGISHESIELLDNFFYLGGNSLLVMRLVSKVRGKHQVLTSDDVFKHPVLQDMALNMVPSVEIVPLEPYALLRSSQQRAIKHQAAAQCQVTENEIEDILPLYSMQEHYVFNYPELGRDSAGPWDWQQQIVFLLPDSLDIPRYMRIWEDAITRYPQLRTRVINTSHGVYQAVLSAKVAPKWHEIEDLDQYVHHDRESRMSFGDELLRLAIKTAGSCHYFVLTMQHLIYDAYSRALLFEELRSRLLGENSSTEAPPHMNQFVKYVNDADRRLGAEFWMSYLEGSSTKALLTAPIGSPFGKLKLQQWSLQIPRLPSLDYTLATIVEISIGLAIGCLLDCKDVIFYSDRAGRNLPIPGIQELMAPTTLFLPLRVPINDRQSVQHLLSTHQAVNTAMIPYEYLGFTELRKLENFKDILVHALNININPYTPVHELGANMDLKVSDEFENWGDPFSINVSIGKEELSFNLCFDENYLSEETAIGLVRAIKEAFGHVSTSHLSTETTVGDVLDKLKLIDR